MSHVLIRVYVHFIWAARNRVRVIDASVESMIRDAIAAQSERLGCPLRAFGASDDHMHALVELQRQVDIVTLVRALKGASANRVSKATPGLLFRWQEGYAAFSVSEGDLLRLVAYINGQRAHHATGRVDTAWEF